MASGRWARPSPTAAANGCSCRRRRCRPAVIDSIWRCGWAARRPSGRPRKFWWSFPSRARTSPAVPPATPASRWPCASRAAAAPPRVLQKPSAGGGTELAIDAVDYDAQGRIALSGRAPPSSRVRLSIDGKPAGEAVADAAGQWRIIPERAVSGDLHTLAIEQIDAKGKVIASTAVPFALATAAHAALARAVQERAILARATSSSSRARTSGASPGRPTAAAPSTRSSMRPTGAASAIPIASIRDRCSSFRRRRRPRPRRDIARIADPRPAAVSLPQGTDDH